MEETSSRKKIQRKTENKMEGCGGEGHEGKRMRRTKIIGDNTLEWPTSK